MGGGGSGGYIKATINVIPGLTTGAISLAAGGLAGAAGASGGNAGASTFTYNGITYTANGGFGATYTLPIVSANVRVGGAGAAISSSTGADAYVLGSGSPGGRGIASVANNTADGSGGNTSLGGGGLGTICVVCGTAVTGPTATANSGSGGAGACNGAGVAATGGAGAIGQVFIREYR